MWNYTFDDHAGYDNMTAAFLIWYGDACNPITVDIKDMPDYDHHGKWDYRHSRLPSAEALAKALVDSLNNSGATINLEGK